MASPGIISTSSWMPFFISREVGKGTGLDLSQVCGFTKQSDGEIDVQSDVGIDTTFRLLSPPRDRGLERAISRAGPEKEVLGARVLIVEDNAQVRSFAKIVREQSPAMRIVLTSGYNHVLVDEERNGFPLLQKPYSAKDVTRALQEAQEAPSRESAT